MTNSGLSIRQLELADMDAAAGVHRTAFDHALPWLTGLHTPEEDRWFYRERVFTGCQVHGAFEGGALAAIIAFRERLDRPVVCAAGSAGTRRRQRIAAGREARVPIASSFGPFSAIWAARRFYEARGFALVEETDGARNEEKEPDARYLWTRASVP